MAEPGFVRVDERLLHGQVLVAWAAALRPRRIVLANDSVAADAPQRAIFESLPDDDYEIAVTTIRAAAEELRAGDRVLVVVASPADALRLVESGAGIGSINLGGLRGAGKRRLTNAIFLGADDLPPLRALLARGVTLEARELPGSRGLVVDVATLDRLES